MNVCMSRDDVCPGVVISKCHVWLGHTLNILLTIWLTEYYLKVKGDTSQDIEHKLVAKPYCYANTRRKNQIKTSC